ncbi:aspartate aminotransferase family protein [Phenylobacterium sp.]|uniref:aspartate aminotransferase family protein n=1 Tax=Phenylobacterium sp. TaxID=1871053 RepID=UPI0025E0E39F|nr:aspartate aminotransferase family protein [Phenylobacterium sp.]
MFPDPQSRSAQLFERARRVQPGANTRHMITFAPYIVYADRGEGCRLTDVDGNVYIDWINNFSTQIHGYAFAPILEAVRAQIERTICCILPDESEIELSEMIVERMPGVDQVRFTNSGTEAMMVAIKAARALTGRSKVAKAEGGYHGQYDLMEASFLPTPANWGPADRPAAPPLGVGTPRSLTDQVVVYPFNDWPTTEALLEESAADLAAVVIDPYPARLGFSPADRAYLDALKAFCRRRGVVLIFDEVFCNRAGYHGAQGRAGVTPDLTVMGKIIGGGFPIGAVGGTREAMAVFDNLAGPLRMSHSGTFTANPVSMAAGIAALKHLTPEVFQRLERQGDRLRSGLTAQFRREGLVMRANGLASMTSLQFFAEPARDYREFYTRSGPDYLQRMQSLHRSFLSEGVLMATRGMMIGSAAMTDADIEETLDRCGRALAAFAGQTAA